MKNSEQGNPPVGSDKAPELFSFREVGRHLSLGDIEGEFVLMREAMKNRFTAERARNICEKSGTHLLKMVSPRTDGENACLYFEDPESNRRPAILPSTSASDIPFCKTIWRPLELNQEGPVARRPERRNPMWSRRSCRLRPRMMEAEALDFSRESFHKILPAG